MNYNAVETSSINIKSVKNVRRDWRPTVAYLCRRRNNYDCTLNITQRSVTFSRPNTDNRDVEKIKTSDFRQITRSNSKTSTVASGLWEWPPIGRCIINPPPISPTGQFAYETVRLLDTSPMTWTFRLHDISTPVKLLDRHNLWLCPPKFKWLTLYKSIAGRFFGLVTNTFVTHIRTDGPTDRITIPSRAVKICRKTKSTTRHA